MQRKENHQPMFWGLIMKWDLILKVRKLGIDIQFKVIPREVFDKKR